MEAETFTPSSVGWKTNNKSQVRGASRVTALNGVERRDGRCKSHRRNTCEDPAGRRLPCLGAPQLLQAPARSVSSVGDTERAIGWRAGFRPECSPERQRLAVRLGFVRCRVVRRLTLSKHEDKNCSGFVRNVDCVLLTTDRELTPEHLQYGPQTWLRVTLGDVYEKPLQIHIFADHHRVPWYSHWHLSKAGTKSGLRPASNQLLAGGEQTPWCNITPMLYQNNGTILNITARYTYYDRADRLKARFEFATAPDESSMSATRAACAVAEEPPLSGVSRDIHPSST